MDQSDRALDASLRAAALGVVAGMRSQLPLAMLALAVRRGSLALPDGAPFDPLRSPRALPLLGVSALGELIGDKLPAVPSRLDPGPLAGRLVFGAAAGAVLARASGAALPPAALLGGTGAFVGAQTGYHARRFLGNATGLPDPVWAVTEDALAIALGLAVTAREWPTTR